MFSPECQTRPRRSQPVGSSFAGSSLVNTDAPLSLLPPEERRGPPPSITVADALLDERSATIVLDTTVGPA
jgi:hypothetical protein